METELIWWVIVPLAAWRLTVLVHRDRIAQPLRRLFGEKRDGLGMPSYPDTFFGYLIACFLCLSVWTGVIAYVVYLLFPYALIPLALSAVSIIIEEKV